MQIILKDVRLAFPALFRPQSFGEGPSRYSATFIIEPNSETAKQVRDAVATVAKDRWADKAQAVLRKLAEDDAVCYKTKPYMNKYGEVYAGFEDRHWLRASNSIKPLVVDRNPKIVLSEADHKVYAGCYVNAKVDIWAQDNQYGLRVNASLLVVQFVRDGEPFGGGTLPSAEGLEDLSGLDDILGDEFAL